MQHLYGEHYVKQLQQALADCVAILDHCDVPEHDAARITKIRCAFLHQQYCHECPDTACCDNLLHDAHKKSPTRNDH